MFFALCSKRTYRKKSKTSFFLETDETIERPPSEQKVKEEEPEMQPEQKEEIPPEPVKVVAETKPEPKIEKVSNHEKLCEKARSTWTQLVEECLTLIRQAIDLLGSVEEDVIREVLENKKVQIYVYSRRSN